MMGEPAAGGGARDVRRPGIGGRWEEAKPRRRRAMADVKACERGVRGQGRRRVAGVGEGRDRLHIRVSSSRSALAPPLVNSEQVCSVLSRVPCLTITDWCVVSDSEVRSSRVSNESSDVSCMNRKCGCGRVCLCGVLHESSHVGVSRDRLTRPIARWAR